MPDPEASENTCTLHTHEAEQRKAKRQVYAFMFGCLCYAIGYITWTVWSHMV